MQYVFYHICVLYKNRITLTRDVPTFYHIGSMDLTLFTKVVTKVKKKLTGFNFLQFKTIAN